MSSSPSRKSHAIDAAAYSPTERPATLRAGMDVLLVTQAIFVQKSMCANESSRTMNVYRRADWGPWVKMRIIEAKSVRTISRKAG